MATHPPTSDASTDVVQGLLLRAFSRIDEESSRSATLNVRLAEVSLETFCLRAKLRVAKLDSHQNVYLHLQKELTTTRVRLHVGQETYDALLQSLSTLLVAHSTKLVDFLTALEELRFVA
ncbi:hypothetical protein ACFE04_015707 [Oxalis oulophora]